MKNDFWPGYFAAGCVFGGLIMLGTCWFENSTEHAAMDAQAQRVVVAEAAMHACTAKFETQTVILETPPAAPASVGLNLLGGAVRLVPGSIFASLNTAAQQAVEARYVIPAQVKPTVISSFPAREQAFFYWRAADGRTQGPYLIGAQSPQPTAEAAPAPPAKFGRQ